MVARPSVQTKWSSLPRIPNHYVFAENLDAAGDAADAGKHGVRKPMTCEELRPDYLLYAMGTMGEPETSEIRAHLDRGCAACIEGLRQADALAYSMGASRWPRSAARARGRVLAISGTEDRRTQPLPLWARPAALWQGWALAAAAMVLALIPGFLWYRELAESRARQAATAALLAEEQRSSASLREAAARFRGDTSRGAVPIFALELERGGGAGETFRPLAIPRGVNAVVLAVPADLARQASAADIRNSSGQTIWTASPLPAGDADSTGLTVAGQLLPPGRYVVVLLAGGRTLARLPFQVTLR